MPTNSKMHPSEDRSPPITPNREENDPTMPFKPMVAIELACTTASVNLIFNSKDDSNQLGKPSDGKPCKTSHASRR
jgi:hypothetical protein